jgi:hypothetical protein
MGIEDRPAEPDAAEEIVATVILGDGVADIAAGDGRQMLTFGDLMELPDERGVVRPEVVAELDEKAIREDFGVMTADAWPRTNGTCLILAPPAMRAEA